mmetsp:Transcript_49359/g.77129  ORF Transcript_49359/g.77129 Transcript_49359/m.77129 type:complete len:148 (+) Transcript_49359:91-534(+)
MLAEIWRKACMMCCMGPICALCRVDIYTLLHQPGPRSLMEKASKEVAELSRKIPGAYVGDECVAETLTYLERIKVGPTPSTLRDIACGRPSEIRELTGALCKLGKEFGVEMPTHEFIASALEAQEALARGEIAYHLEGVPGGKPFFS